MSTIKEQQQQLSQTDWSSAGAFDVWGKHLLNRFVFHRENLLTVANYLLTIANTRYGCIADVLLFLLLADMFSNSRRLNRFSLI